MGPNESEQESELPVMLWFFVLEPTSGERRVKIWFWSDSKPVSVILGQHRALGPSISKVRSLKLDSSIWSNELVEVGSLSKDPE